MPRQAGQGRQRIDIAKIKKDSSLAVAFSKRRTGLFNKASEICTLCGVRMAMIVFSQYGKTVYSFGNPSVEEIVNDFLEQSTHSPCPRTSELVEEFRNANFEELNSQLSNMLGKLEAEKKAGKDLRNIRKESQENCWWDAPIEDLGVEKLETLKVAMLELKAVSEKQAKRLTAEGANRTSLFSIFGSNWAGRVDP